MPLDLALSGSYPRKEDLVKATWNFDKGLTTAAQLQKVQDEAAKEVIQLQERLGFAPVTDGLLTWQDAFRPLVETSPSFEVGGVTRLFETNKFYRQPILHKPPKLNWAKLEPFFPHARFKSKAGWKAILPNPYWFARVTKDEVYGDPGQLGAALAKYLGEIAARLDSLGYKEIQFTNAALFYEREPNWGIVKAILAGAPPKLKARSTINFPNGNAAPHANLLTQVWQDTVGIDFVETRLEDLPARPLGKHLLAQVVDSQESLLEDPTEVSALVQRIEKRLKPLSITLSHTWDLEFVPTEVAQKKLEVLAKVARAKEVVA